MQQSHKIILGILIAAGVIWGASVLKTDTASAPATAGDSPDLTIGFMGPLTGDAASYGESIKRGVDMAVEDAGLAHVKVVYEDSKCDGKEAAAAANKLISVDGAVAIVGEVCSGATLAAAPIADANGVVLVSPSSTSPELTGAGKWFFRTIPSDALQGKFGAKLVHDAGHERLAIIYGNEEYGVGFADVLARSFTALGGTVVESESFERGVTDVRTQLTKIKADDPDALFIISNSPASAVAILKQAKELGLGVALYGSEGLKSPDVIDGAGDAAEGLTLSTVSSGTTGFTEQHMDAYGSEPGPFAAQGYDAFMAIARAIKDGARTSEEIRAAMSTMAFDGMSGLIEFDEHGDVSGNYDVFTVTDGEFVAAK